MEKYNAPILTPDQRLRVFISSTLQELAEERAAVKQAIQNLHLIPVMFELGARPHAPRNLYREYLAQSQIFIGIYWDRYGWIAPEEEISGLEDEYNLSGNLPKLIYIKNSSGQREDRLAQLLQRIEKDDKVSYKTFESAGDLENLIVNDLALLLTERFNLTKQNKISESEFKTFNSIPAIPNALIGREKNIEEITTLLSQPEIRLVTLTGPGGIGKTRLGIETARMLQPSYPDGAGYVPLAPVKDHTLVAETICYTLGIKVSGGNISESLKLFLQDKKFLLVLDNFEQVVEAASIVDDLLMAAPGLKIIVTSRERLSLSFEHIYIVPTLPDAYSGTVKENVYPAAVELFIQRAKATQPSFNVTEQNRDIIFKICHRLEGLPLAIELAAGQINLFSPALLLQKLDHRLDVLKANLRDIPDRQKTIRNTIEWSFELLSAEEQNLLLHISLYNAGCLLITLETIFSTGEEVDIYAIIGSLINKSLLMKQDEDFQVRFQVLESVREFAYEKLKAQDLLIPMQQIQDDYYFEALKGIKLQKNKVDQVEILKFLEKEHPNIRQALDFLIQNKDVKKATIISWNLWLFWWVNAHTNEGYAWVKKAWELNNEQEGQLDEYTFAVLACNVGLMAFLQRDFPMFQVSMYQHLELIRKQDDDELVATATMITGVVKTILKEYEEAEYMLQIGLARFKKTGLTTGVSLALSALGRNSIYKGNGIAEAKEYYKESMALAKQDHNEIAVIICLSGFALCEVMEKNSDAKNYLRESILLSQSLHFYEAFAWSIEIWALVSINENKFIHAITLMGAVDHLRTSTQMPVWDDLQAIIVDARNSIEQQMPPHLFKAAWNEGAAMSLDKMVAYALEAKEEPVMEEEMVAA